MKRCDWAVNESSIAYHDKEWGVPVHDDRHLFEMIILEGAQAGLSWITILKKREHYRKVIDGFDAKKIARYDERKVAQLLADPGIVRNRLKIAETIQNGFMKVRRLKRETWMSVKNGITQRSSSRTFQSRMEPRTTRTLRPMG